MMYLSVFVLALYCFIIIVTNLRSGMLIPPVLFIFFAQDCLGTTFCCCCCVCLYTNFRMMFSISMKSIMGIFAIGFVLNLYITFSIRSFSQYRCHHYISLKCSTIHSSHSIFRKLTFSLLRLLTSLFRLTPTSLFMTVSNYNTSIISSSCLLLLF